jgi:hypothetical protein
LLCPIVHFLAKALAEGAIERRGLDTRADPYFNTKLGMPAVYIPWKKEFWHKPVFRKTVPGVEGPEKSDDPMTVGSLDTGTEKLGLAAGLLEGLNTYDYRRGTLEVIDSKYLSVRRRATV